MPGLPVVSGKQAAHAFEKAGWSVARHGKHIVLVKAGSLVSLSVPDHRELAPGTLRILIRYAGLSVEKSAELL